MSKKTKTPAVVDQQLEIESTHLLLIALKPLSKAARARVLAFVQSQLDEIEGGELIERRRIGFPFLYNSIFGDATSADDDGGDDE